MTVVIDPKVVVKAAGELLVEEIKKHTTSFQELNPQYQKKGIFFKKVVQVYTDESYAERSRNAINFYTDLQPRDTLRNLISTANCYINTPNAGFMILSPKDHKLIKNKIK